jgi:UDP-N-acetylglucosamine 1-carboxyvinyltransferase
MVIAGMCAVGTTTIEDVHFIERGYENFVGKLRALGAEIEVVNDEEDEMNEHIIYVG